MYPPEIRQLLSDAGFGAVEIYGDFKEGPFTRGTDELMIVAQRP